MSALLLADDIRQCDGLVTMMSFWTFSDVFEEGGPKREPFDGGFGLMAMGGIKKPSYSAFGLLHQLGNERIAQDASNVLVTRRPDGSLVIAAWNLVDPDRKGEIRNIEFKINGVPSDSTVRVHRADSNMATRLPPTRTWEVPDIQLRRRFANSIARRKKHPPRMICDSQMALLS